ncbi:MAG: ATP-binding protein [Candidatus Methanomethylophilaceae archaeon]|nr:ATP-binding protein [Candidatus Methanomethylophilaceae archaeon]
MLYRKMMKRIEDFYAKNDGRALIVDGVRQCGKTFIIREFGRKHFEVFSEINLIEKPVAKDILSGSSNSEDMLFRLSAISDVKLIPGKTLIFLDEVQEAKDMITWIKFLVEDGRYRFILSGSLLGLELDDIRSIPIGYADVYHMYPMDLEEFFIALNVSHDILDHVHDCFNRNLPVDPFIHDRLYGLFKLYLIVGGMPEVVNTYLNGYNLSDVVDMQQSIIKMYYLDMAKYDYDNKLAIHDVFDRIPPELSKQNKRFKASSLGEKFRIDRKENTFVWLADSGIALPTYNASEPRWPLILSKDSTLFKLFLCDVGLLSSMIMGGIQQEILTDKKDVKYGGIYENYAAMELSTHGYPLFYYNNKKRGELDFLIEEGSDTIPIEIKSGKDYKRHSALSNIFDVKEYGIEKGYVVHNGNLEVDGRIIYIPTYMLMCFQKDKDNTPGVVKPNLEGLTSDIKR